MFTGSAVLAVTEEGVMYSWAQLCDGLDYSGRRLCGCESCKEDESGMKNGQMTRGSIEALG